MLLEAFAANQDVLDTPAPAVQLDGVDGGQLMFNATGFADSPRKSYGVRSELLFDILKRLKDAGITLARPPTMLLHAPLDAQALAAPAGGWMASTTVASNSTPLSRRCKSACTALPMSSASSLRCSPSSSSSVREAKSCTSTRLAVLRIKAGMSALL